MTRARGKDLIVGLDVGTTKVCAVIAEAPIPFREWPSITDR